METFFGQEATRYNKALEAIQKTINNIESTSGEFKKDFELMRQQRVPPSWKVSYNMPPNLSSCYQHLKLLGTQLTAWSQKGNLGDFEISIGSLLDPRGFLIAVTQVASETLECSLETLAPTIWLTKPTSMKVFGISISNVTLFGATMDSTNSLSTKDGQTLISKAWLVWQTRDTTANLTIPVFSRDDRLIKVCQVQVQADKPKNFALTSAAIFI